MEPDSLTPREALEVLYRLQAHRAERAMSLLDIESRRAIIDRRAVTEQIAAVRPGKKQGTEVDRLSCARRSRRAAPKSRGA